MSTEEAVKFTGVIYDPDKDSRMRLKTATVSVSDFETVTPCASDREALSWVEKHQQIDLVFISEKIPARKIERFIEACKANPKAELAAFVVIKNSNLGGIKASEAILLGADGILCEPFSVDNLMEIIALARRLSREREQVRRRLGLTLVIADMISQIDAAAYLKSQGSKTLLIQKTLRKLGEKLRELAQGDEDNYYDVLIRLTEKARPMNGALRTRLYEGPSNAVRRKVEVKLWNEIAALQKLKDDEGKK